MKHVLLLALLAEPLLAAPPVVRNVWAAQIPGTHQVRITYDLSADTACKVSVQAWLVNPGTSLNIQDSAYSGDVGPGVAIPPGVGKSIILTVAETVAGVTTVKAPALQDTFTKNLRFKIYATPSTFAELVRIRAGNFQMGDQSNPLVGYYDERPVHTVYVSEFYIAKYETTKELWDVVRAWGMAADRGYTDLSVGGSKGVNHPVHSVSWYDIIKWCNARSEMENLVPCYYRDAAQSLVYKTGSVDIGNTMVKWSANGYRLPTEAEWEKAARGGVPGKNFPWGNEISQSQANYDSGFGSPPAYDVSPTLGPHPIYGVGLYPLTSPVGSFAPEPYYGLYDMAGNMAELCWDWYQSNYYNTSLSTDPTGPATQTGRVVRGGWWGRNAYECRVSERYSNPPAYKSFASTSFRLVRSSVP